jgi:hypothetical protein
MSTADANIITEEANLTTEDANIITEDANLTTEDANIITEEANLTTEDIRVPPPPPPQPTGPEMRVVRYELYPKDDPTCYCVGFRVACSRTQKEMYVDTQVPLNEASGLSEHAVATKAYTNVKDQIEAWKCSLEERPSILGRTFVPDDEAAEVEATEEAAATEEAVEEEVAATEEAVIPEEEVDANIA